MMIQFPIVPIFYSPLVLVYIATNRSPSEPVGLVMLIYFLVTSFIVMPWVNIYVLRRRLRTWFAREKRRCLSESKCPACLGDMRGLPVEEDGCVVCPNPECGGAWKLTERVAQP
ncbi:MAG: hypothetical protein D8M59_13205 [Planctomycetes bacterium]|nr:hypothetical protein [Planctomycetota bacterium]NOG54960.1 hypothetical protein [Planctomycetota bacterium]